VVEAYGLSDKGTVRKTNEDSFVIDEELQLFAVADGMGGHNAGEVASRLAIEALVGFIRRSGQDSDFSWPYGHDPKLSFAGNRLKTAVHLANRRVFRAAEDSDDYTGMGTTVASVLVSGRRIVVGNVGDSRVYALTNGKLRQITHDDSWAATLLAQEGSTEAGALAHHPMRNVLTNVLGAREQTDIHITEEDLEQGEVILICSDGLHGVVDDETLRGLMSDAADLQMLAKKLVETALARGSRDNITALVARYGGGNQE
jgi:protein phosphatase